MSKNEHLMTSKQVSILLNVDVRTVHRMVRDGRLLPVLKVPGITGAWLFNRSAVEALAAERPAA